MTTAGEVETTLRHYLAEAGGDPERALRTAIVDALLALESADERVERTAALVSRGYARLGLAEPRCEPDEMPALLPVAGGRA